MTARAALVALLALGALAGCRGTAPPEPPPPAPDPALAPPPPPASTVAPPLAGSAPVPREADPREKRLRNLRQITVEGENAEAYWSFDGTRLVLQHRGEGVAADQIYAVGADGTGVRLVSTGWGKTTCSFFLPGDREAIFASTHAAGLEAPPPPDMSRGYTWAVYASFDIYARDLETGSLRRLTDSPGYDAECVVSPDGKRIVFTSARDGDLDLYTMNLDGSDVRRVTSELGYDGGAFFSPDSKRLCYRARHPETEEDRAKYLALLGEGLIRPTALEIFVCDADGGNRVQVTRNGAANFAPFFHPDGKRIIFASNMDDPRGREFDLYLVGVDGSGLERVTFTAAFDGFPMFSPDGKTLAFCSNRHGARRGDTNVFLADWVE